MPPHGPVLPSVEIDVVAGEVDGLGPPVGTTTLRTYSERLAADDPDA